MPTTNAPVSNWVAYRHSLEVERLANRIQEATSKIDTRVAPEIILLPSKYVSRQCIRRQAKYLEIEEQNRKLLNRLQVISHGHSYALRLAGYQRKPSSSQQTCRINVHSGTRKPNDRQSNFSRSNLGSHSLIEAYDEATTTNFFPDENLGNEDCCSLFYNSKVCKQQRPASVISQSKGRISFSRVNSKTSLKGPLSINLTTHAKPRATSDRLESIQRLADKPPYGTQLFQNRQLRNRSSIFPGRVKQEHTEAESPEHWENLLLSLVAAPTPGRKRISQSPHVGETTRRNRLLARLEGGIRNTSLFCLDEHDVCC